MNKTLFLQKIFLMITLLVSYVFLLVVFVVYNEKVCKSYVIFKILHNTDIASCMTIRYLTFVYYCLTAIITITMIISSYIIKTKKITNPFSFLQTTRKRSSVLIFIPVFSESMEELSNTLNSVLLNDYPNENKTIFIVVDGKVKGRNNDDYTSNYARDLLDVGFNHSYSNEYDLYIGIYKNMDYILFIKSNNKGKKNSFLTVMKILNISHCRYNEASSYISFEDSEYEYIHNRIYDQGIDLHKINYTLMLDTDTKINADGITKLVDYLDSYPFTSAVCGNTKITNKTDNIITLSQCYEYYITHYGLKSVECVYGDVLVLSGCFSLYRSEIICDKRIIKQYEIENDKNIYQANLTKLGEDRLLTNLIMTRFPMFNTRYIEQAVCFTKAPTSFKTFLSQRRRWTNSMLFCNLMLLWRTPRYNITKRIRFILIILFEIWIILYLPVVSSYRL
jgi:cellulose synthase/poly-beta-1,6-N-acetylglucosamine synthase-like glycosyltransferase